MKQTFLAPLVLACLVGCSDDTPSGTGSSSSSSSSGAPGQDGGSTQNDGGTSEGGPITPTGGGTGALDPTFKSPGGVVFSLALKPDGKLFIAGSSGNYAGVDRSKIALLEPDGTANAGFVPVPTETNNAIAATALLPDGRIAIGGNFNSANMVRIARLGTDGKRDGTFNVGGKGSEGAVSALLRQPDGKIIVSGYLTRYNETPCGKITRISEDGTVDAGFAPGLGAGPSNSIVRALALQPDGKILVGGVFQTFDSKSRKNIARLNANGSLDESFNPGETGEVNSIVVQADGKVLVAGGFTKWNGLAANGNYLVRLGTDGALDSTFKAPFAVEEGVLAGITTLALQNDGKIIAGGSFGNANLTGRKNLARFNADGSLDSGYTPPEKETSFIGISVLLLQPDGKLLVGGDGGVIRLN